MSCCENVGCYGGLPFTENVNVCKWKAILVFSNGMEFPNGKCAFHLLISISYRDHPVTKL